jgi:phosphoribosylaminoimidazolecarboxamide formyltransferase/IMP cyclohydrolase
VEFGYGPAAQPAAVGGQAHQPCGVATGSGTADALQRALDADRVSAFGGIVALNTSGGSGCGRAPEQPVFGVCGGAWRLLADALSHLAAKANLRLLALSPEAIACAPPASSLRSVLGGVLVQELDDQAADERGWQVVSERQPTPRGDRGPAFCLEAWCGTCAPMPSAWPRRARAWGSVPGR